MTVDAQTMLELADKCAKYDFDTIEMIECKWELWDQILEALRRQPQRMWSAPAEFVMWALVEGCWQGHDVDGGAAQDKAVELGLIVATQYDPKKHGESAYCEPGDQWFVPSESLLAALSGKPGAAPQRPADALRLLAELFSESVHWTWTTGEIVNVIEDAIKLGSSHARPESNTP